MSTIGERRSKLDILTKILQAVAPANATATHIMYSARLNFHQTQRFLNFLLDVNLIRRVKTDGRVTYGITEKGLLLLDYYKKVQELIKMEK